MLCINDAPCNVECNIRRPTSRVTSSARVTCKKRYTVHETFHITCFGHLDNLTFTLRFVWHFEKVNVRYLNVAFKHLALRSRFVHHIEKN